MTESAAQQQDAAAGATLLLVDDEQNILSSLRRIFRPMNYRVLTAASGREGLEVLARESVDLVISDMRMPEMDGAAFLEQAAQRWPDTVRILLTGYADITSTVAAVNKGGIYKYISKPWEEHDLRISVQRALEQKRLEEERRRLQELTQRQNEELRDLNANLERKVEERTRELQRAMARLRDAHESLKKGYTASVRVFSGMLELRGNTVAGHARRVAELAHKLAVALGADDGGAQDVLFAALLHDIGKIGLPDSVLAKPFNDMEYAERAEVVKHPEIGEALLMSLDALHEAARLIRSHHEHYDGAGYPDGLKGEDIPFGARVLAVVNDYDALQAGTLLASPLSAAEAFAYVVEHSGKRYDPLIVDAFRELLEKERQESRDPETAVGADKLEPGMLLARDMVTKSGVVLLQKGRRLDFDLIEKIQRLAKATGVRPAIYVVKTRA